MNQIGRPDGKGEDEEDDYNIHREREKLVLDNRPRASSDKRHGGFPALPTIAGRNRYMLLPDRCSSGFF